MKKIAEKYSCILVVSDEGNKCAGWMRVREIVHSRGAGEGTQLPSHPGL